MASSVRRRTFVERMMGAAQLQGDVYEEVEHDRDATGQAAAVVVLGAVAAGIGGLSGGLVGLIVGIVTGLIAWGVYAYVAYWVGTRWFKGRSTSATWGELLRTLGFANTPRLLLVVGIIPIAGLVLGLIVLIWTLVTTVVAIRQALDFELGSAIATAVVSWLALLAISFVVTAVVSAVV